MKKSSYGKLVFSDVTAQKHCFGQSSFLNGKYFCLRGGDEHRSLKFSQLKRHHEPDHYVYMENASKNRSGGLAQMRVTNKIVPIYASPESGTRCHVYILNKYISKVPQDAVAKDNFYLQPLSTIPKCPNKPWFSCTPVGRNTLAKAVGEMCTKANISAPKTNHSLRATDCSKLFQAGVPEKVIQQRTGHLSLQGMHHYEHTTSQQQQAVSRILNSDEEGGGSCWIYPNCHVCTCKDLYVSTPDS